MQTDIEDNVISKVTIEDRIKTAITNALNLINKDHRCWFPVTETLLDNLTNLVGPGSLHKDDKWRAANLPEMMRDFRRQVDEIVR